MGIRYCSFFTPTPVAHAIHAAKICLLNACSAADIILGAKNAVSDKKDNVLCSSVVQGDCELVIWIFQ